ncbi:hypothetical protein SAMN02744784_04253 [Stenotrophomonas sp. CC120223-11]|nr:hypothetical protein SAMN02744784_04253 [Stenotrophomonas sp. CC120223-11]
MCVPEAVRVYTLVNSGFLGATFQHVADIGLRGNGIALEGAENWCGAFVQLQAILFAKPKIKQSEGRIIEADRSGLMAFAVMYSDRAAFAVDIALIERKGFTDPQTAPIQHRN